MFPITCQSFIAIGWTVYAPLGKVQHRVLQLVQFSKFLNFQNHPEHVYNNLWKFHCIWTNRLRSECKATPGTPASTMKRGWSCRQWLSSCFKGQVCKISSTSMLNFINIYAKFNQDRIVGQHQVLQLAQWKGNGHVSCFEGQVHKISSTFVQNFMKIRM